MLYSRRDSGEVQCSSHEFLLCCITFYVPGHHDMLYTTPSWQALLWGTTKSPLLPLLVALCRLILSEVNVISSFFQRRGLKPYSPLTCSNYAFTFRFQTPIMPSQLFSGIILAMFDGFRQSPVVSESDVIPATVLHVLFFLFLLCSFQTCFSLSALLISAFFTL